MARISAQAGTAQAARTEGCVSDPKKFPPKEAISVSLAAHLLDVHENTIYNWIRSGSLIAVRVGPRLVRIPRSEIARLRSNQIINNSTQ